MNKLIVTIGAVAAAFGVHAATPYATSFEGEAFSPTDGWSAGENDSLTLTQYGDNKYVYGTEALARRTSMFTDSGSTNDQYLDIQTGKDSALTRTLGDENICIDQLVKFTGYEEDPVLDDNAKIAVWLKATETEPATETEAEIPGETNLYVSVAKQVDNDVFTTNHVKIAGTFTPDTWYRLSVKFMGDVINAEAKRNGVPARGAFMIYIDGQPATIVESDRALAVDEIFTAKAADLYSKGQLFPCLTATTAVASVAYQGIGAIDDLIIDETGPDYMAEVNATITVPTGVAVASVTAGGVTIVANENGTYTVMKGATIIVTLTNDGAYVLSTTQVTFPNVTGAVDLRGMVTATAAKASIGKNYYKTLKEAIADAETAATAEKAVEVELLANDGVEYAMTKDDIVIVKLLEGDVVAVAADGTWTIENVDPSVIEGSIVAKTLVFGGPVKMSDDLYVGNDGKLIAASITVNENEIELDDNGLVITKSALVIADAFTAPAKVKETVDDVAGTYTYELESESPESAVVKIGTRGYATLAAAVEAAVAGDELVVQQDIALDSGLAIEKSITLNLGAKTLTTTDTILVAGNVTIANGKVSMTGTSTDYILRVNSGDVVIASDAVLSLDNGGGHSNEFVVLYGGTLTVNGKVDASKSGAVFAIVARANNVTVTCNDGCVVDAGKNVQAIKFNCQNGASQLVINGGTITGHGNGSSAIYMNKPGNRSTIAFNGGVLSGGILFTDGNEEYFTPLTSDNCATKFVSRDGASNVKQLVAHCADGYAPVKDDGDYYTIQQVSRVDVTVIANGATVSGIESGKYNATWLFEGIKVYRETDYQVFTNGVLASGNFKDKEPLYTRTYDMRLGLNEPNQTFVFEVRNLVTPVTPEITLSATTAEYSDTLALPTVSVTGDYVLDTDYTVEWDKELPTANPAEDYVMTVTVTMKGDYSGSASKTFTVTPKSQSETDWDHPKQASGTAAEMYGIEGALADANGQKLAAWAKDQEVDFSDVNSIKVDAFLLNCENTDDAIRAAKAAFKFAAIEPGKVPTISGDYNGTITIQGSADLKTWHEATTTDSFFKAVLSL